jgi:DNA repair protein RecO (recombination protein O)
MLYKTRGIVLGSINYKDTSIITKIYTEEFGLRSYIVNGAKSSKKGNKMAYFQSLSLLDMVVYENESRDIQRISEQRLFHAFNSISFHHTKNIIVMFLSELLLKCLKEESANPHKFIFLVNEIISLDESKKGFEDFHLHFMMKLSSYMGFQPTNSQDFKELQIHLKPDIEILLENILTENKYPTKGIDRSNILDVLIHYYQFHIDNFGAFKSIKVLREVVHN